MYATIYVNENFFESFCYIKYKQKSFGATIDAKKTKPF